MQTEGNKLLFANGPHQSPTVTHRTCVYSGKLCVPVCTSLLYQTTAGFFRLVVLNLQQGLLYILSVLHCWARSSGCQDLSHICAVTQSFLSAVCLCLRGASHELSNEVLTIALLSRCCLWFYGKQETCILKNHYIWPWLHTENSACGSSSSNV